MKPEFEKIQNEPLHSFIRKTVIRPKRLTLKEAWHFHPEVEICLTVKSEGKRFVGNNISDYQSGDLVMFGGNLPHGYITRKKSEQIVIQMREDFLGNEFLEKPETIPIKELFNKAKRGLRFFGETEIQAKQLIKKVMEAEDFLKILHLLELLNLLAHSNDKEYIVTEGFHPKTGLIELERVQIVYDYILENYQERVSLEEASRLISMTKSSFCKFLKKHAKKTFSQIVNEIRIAHACDLMIRTNKKISTIAFESGYNDTSYFSRTFKKIIKISPKEFMERYS